MSEVKTYRCPAFVPAQPGALPQDPYCKETSISGQARFAKCPIGATACEAITPQQAQSDPYFLRKWRDTVVERIESQKNSLG